MARSRHLPEACTIGPGRLVALTVLIQLSPDELADAVSAGGISRDPLRVG